jgi:hypothetical protein
MKANELRLNNLVLDYGIITPVNYLMISRLVGIEDSGKICINLTPLPLKEEWLVKLGFEKGVDDYLNEQPVFRKGIEIYCHVNSHTPYEWSLYNYNDKKVYINFVHQLQNLYFALTGEELTIK